MARIPPKTVSKDDAEVLRALDETLKRVVYGQDEGASPRCPRPSSWPAPACAIREKPIGNYLFAGPTGVGKTEVARQLVQGARRRAVRFDMSEYMERHTVSPPHRRASRLCRLRPGRPADRRHRPASALRAAARRDREGASRSLQHPAADHGPREADRSQRQAGRLPQRDPDHDHERRRGRHGQARLRLRRRPSARATTTRRSTACSRRNSATGSTRSSPSATCRRKSSARSSTSSSRSSKPSSPTATSRSSSPTRRATWLVENGYDETMGARPMARAHPAAHQDAAGRRGAVRHGSRTAAPCASSSARRTARRS